MPDISRLPDIIDASAAVAAAYVPGVTSAYGVGADNIVIPAGGVLAGRTVPQWPGDVVEAGTHVSMLSTFTKLDRSGTVAEMTWTIEMRFYVSRNDLGSQVAAAAKIVPAYMTAFSQHVQLLGTIGSGSALVNRGGLVVPEEGSSAWLLFYLNAIERLDFANVAG